MKSVLHIITGLGDGGAEAVLYRLCKHDRGRRHHVISLIDAGKYGPLLADLGVTVTCLEMLRWRVPLSGLSKMWRTIRQLQPDAVQTWMYHANLLGGIVAWLAGQRNICWGIHHCTLDPASTPRSTILVDRVSARLSRWIPRHIVCCAEKARKVHGGMGYDPERMLVIPNGYDFSTFQPDPEGGAGLRSEMGLDPLKLVIGFVARFHPLKGHANLLQALACMRDKGLEQPVCLLAGTGMVPENGELTGMISDLKLTDHVRLLGPRNDIPAVMSALDLHVMSSLSEGFPNVLAEAMACGTPCVSTDVGDAAVILGDTGSIVPPNDPVALADAIGEMLAARASSTWAVRQSAARCHVVNNFSINRMIDSYCRAWFESVPSGEQGSGTYGAKQRPCGYNALASGITR